MIAEVQPGGKVDDVFVELAAAITGRPEPRSGAVEPSEAHYRKVHPPARHPEVGEERRHVREAIRDQRRRRAEPARANAGRAAVRRASNIAASPGDPRARRAASRHRRSSGAQVRRILPDQEDDLRRADRGDRSRAAFAARTATRRARRSATSSTRSSRLKNVVMSIAEQEELLDDICNDVLGYGPLEPLLARDDIADIMVNGAGQDLHRGPRQDPADQHPLPRQPAADEHLPADRQPGRPPRRRILADLRRAPARRLARQRDRAAARDRRPDAHDPQVQEGQAHPRAARASSARSRPRGRDPRRSSAASAATS